MLRKQTRHPRPPEAAAVAPAGGGSRASLLLHIGSAHPQVRKEPNLPPVSLMPGTCNPGTPHRKGLTHHRSREKTHRNGHGRTGDSRHSKLPRASGWPHSKQGQGDREKTPSWRTAAAPGSSVPDNPSLCLPAHGQARPEPSGQDPTNTEAIQAMAQRKRSQHPWDGQTDRQTDCGFTERWR